MWWQAGGAPPSRYCPWACGMHELDMDHFAVCGVNMMSSTTCRDEFWDHYVKVRAEGFPRGAKVRGESEGEKVKACM